jgi:hypothetical protein
MRSFLALVALACAIACGAYDQPCACKGRWSDPTGAFPQNGPTVQHTRGDHCACRCGGAGEERLMPPFQKDCKSFEVACTKDDGSSARFVCE